MTYGELIRFEPIESRVRLCQSADPGHARQLVESYVVSDEIAGRLNAIFFPHLRIDAVCDTKGLLIIGGRGIGKSHLMAVVAAIAEDRSLAGEIHHRDAAEAAATVAGQFKVIRAEVAANVPDLRKHLCWKLEAGLAQWGIQYAFPNGRRGRNYRQCFADMMAAFHRVFPDKGLLLAVEELLDYLRGRGRRGLRQDLAFLRELGAACSKFRFRLLAGLREPLSNHTDALLPRNLVQRVLDCFIQVPMPRNSLRFVVQHRLLRKTPEQEARVREYLGPFMQFYGSMEDRLEEYVAMFPVHPDYLDVVARVACVEKTDVLHGLSDAVKKILDKPLPREHPGLIAYDSYWEQLQTTPETKAIPDVQAVMVGSRRLEAALSRSEVSPDRQPHARRLIHALAVHRLTTHGIYTPRPA